MTIHYEKLVDYKVSHKITLLPKISKKSKTHIFLFFLATKIQRRKTFIDQS
jgi:hypothetical protein